MHIAIVAYWSVRGLDRINDFLLNYNNYTDNDILKLQCHIFGYFS